MKKLISLLTAFVLILSLTMSVLSLTVFGSNKSNSVSCEAILSSNEFISSAKVTASEYGTVDKTSVTADFLPFTDTLTLSCAKVPASASVFGLNCTVDTQRITSNGNVVLLTFYARASSANQKVEACVLGENNATMAKYSYYIPTQWTKICMPVTVSGKVTGISLFAGAAEGRIEFGGISLNNYGTDTATKAAEKLMYTLPQGYFLMEDFENVSLEYSSNAFTVQAEVDDLCSYKNNLFAIGNGEFRIYERQEDKSLSLVSSISGLGETRQLRITEDGNTAVVTARASKAYVIDCSDREKPVIASRYDSVEYATGLAVGDGRAYITNRMFGTEIIDISDPYNVKNLSVLRTGEGQSCALSGSTLYIGCWAQKCVEVWDVADPSNAKLITKNIPLSGLGDGVVIDGNILYAATGHYETDDAKAVNKIGYGLGNGMDIYDVSDLKNPVRLATVKIDDHFYQLGGDYWKVVLGYDNNKKYAYLINTYTGVYVYDVTDPSKPVRRAHLTLDVDKTASSTLYKSSFSSQTNNGTNRYYPYDVTKKGQDLVTGVCSYNGELYISGDKTGIAIYHADYAKNELVPDNRGTSKQDSNTFYKLDTKALSNAGLTDISYAKPIGQVAGAVKYGDYIYAACGAEGIIIYDESLNQKAVVKTQDITSDIQIFGNRIYTAEGLGGICVYEISNNGLSLNKISGYVYKDKNGIVSPVTVVRLSPNANFVLCDSGSSTAELVDFRNIENPVSYKRTRLGGLYYSRQASNGTPVANRFLCIYDHLKSVQWYDFGEDTGNDPIYFTRLKTLGMYSGLTSVGSNALISWYGQYYLLDPLNSDITDANSFRDSSISKVYTYTTASGKTDKSFIGKPIAFGNLLLITSKKDGKFRIVDIANSENPKLLVSLSFNGNPDIAYFKDGEIILSLGYQGILKFRIKDTKLPVDVTFKGNAAVDYNGITYRENQIIYPENGKELSVKLSAPEGKLIHKIYWNGNEIAQDQAGKETATVKFTPTESGVLTVECGTFTENIRPEYLKTVATCGSKAVYYKSCSDCGLKSTETFEAGDFDYNNHVGDTYVKNHRDATCYEEGNEGDTYCRTCEREISKGKIIPKTNHKHTEIRNAKPATEQDKGYTGDTWCTDCDKKIAAGSEIAKLEHKPKPVEAKDATVTEQGNIKYYYCDNCGKYFADEDGTKEISLSETVIKKLPPEIIEGNNAIVNNGEKKSLTFRSNAAFSDFIKVELDGKTLDEKDYTKAEGSIIVTLNNDFVSTLSVGEHTLGIVSESGTATARFTVKATDSSVVKTTDNLSESPKTGEDSMILVWSLAAFASFFVLVVTAVIFKKKRSR